MRRSGGAWSTSRCAARSQRLDDLDYGCNQGGFLRLLYDNHPFKAAVGIDIARESVARAELLKGHRPISYRVADQAGHARPDLRLRLQPRGGLPAARRRRARPRHRLGPAPGGTYIAAIGCHTDSSLWPRWRKTDRRDLVDPDLRPFAGKT
jgi:hypothetical protein